MASWTVLYKAKVKKQIKTVPEYVRSAMQALHIDLEFSGPAAPTWPNYSKFKGLKKA